MHPVCSETLHFTSTGIFHHHLVTDRVYLAVAGELFTISLFK